MTVIEHVSVAGRVERPAKVKVWDGVVRLFHWSLVTAFVIAWLSADDWGRVHESAGYFIGGLIGFRVFWGLIGTRHARFTDFIYRPSTVLSYMRDSLAGRAKRYLGHNPAGGAMVIGLLSSLIAVTATGIMMTTDTYWGVEWVEDLHEGSVNLMIILIALHIAGVIHASLDHRENLVWSMFTGRKRKK